MKINESDRISLGREVWALRVLFTGVLLSHEISRTLAFFLLRMIQKAAKQAESASGQRLGLSGEQSA